MYRIQVVLILFALFSIVPSKAARFPVNLVGIFVSQPDLLLNYNVLRPTLHIAAREAEKRFPNLKVQITMRNDTDSCYGNIAANIAAEEYFKGKVSAFIGPSCDFALEQVGRMASYWNIPVFTAGGWSLQFSDKNIFKTLTRLSFSLDKVCHFLLQVIKEFDWHHLSVIVDESDLYMTTVAKALDILLKKEMDSKYNIRVNIQAFESKSNTTVSYKKLLEDGRRSARVLTKASILRDILLSAYDMQMNNGEYTFFTMELIKSKNAGENIGWYKLGDRRNKEAKIIYEALLIVSVKIPVSAEFDLFVTNVVKSAREEFDSSVHIEELNPVVAAFYDTVTLLAWAVNKTLVEGENPNDGTVISRKLWNSTFLAVGLTGDILVNENGDREADYTLNDFDPNVGIPKPVAYYFGAKRLYQKIEGVEIHWPGGGKSAPADVPTCGFNGDALHCVVKAPFPPAFSALIVLTTLVIITTVIGYFISQKLKLEARLADDWWKINYADIKIYEKGAKKSSTSITTNMTESSHKLSKAETFSVEHTPTINVTGILVGDYHGIKVAVKTLDVKRVHVTRQTRIELNNIRDLLHDNLVRFFGMCVEEPNNCIVSELGIRGSLRDVLENDSMNIDQTFKYAMINDIAEGMLYLHNSVVQYHGHLKSTNLVIDARFTVKICDYGLRSVYKQIEKNREVTNPRQLFWTAPEHLRDNNPLLAGSKKGDIFSFAIIMQEVITRSGPYESLERLGRKRQITAPEEILDKLKIGTVPPFRPEVASDECPVEMLDLMKVCWAENPNERPDFPWIKARLRKITKGTTSKNLLTNLLKRMEEYSNTMERTVAERGESIVEEKKKVEELLHQILPKFVAEELKQGRHVKPESFDSVTIYFSDIIGFADLAAESNPDEVVDLLNDIYSIIDGIIANYDVYKVETITDSYLIASGLPVRNGNNHAREIAKMALDIRSAIFAFQPRHRPNYKCEVRIGIHSGSCVAGVIGLKMPKYCLFGDTINTASRMETSSEPSKIHISSKTKNILDIFGNFIITARGEVQLKGKGTVKTFWLEGEVK
ncbi:atrial natriuretic peptide receptor 1-like protein [Leptotrombidium deliense]|uniref:Guanylate cyclase n=1 Tax=Leptotrombidium deliense TaxID=299467 RepID=A0A443SNN1_9ACAR|nr:atrial natriuretic peptide receptor 1-like protein [Leptotrombidium deliense]